MTHLLLVFLYLAQFVQGTTNGTGSDNCPPPDGMTRSVWSILGGCALTLLICLWHAIHFNVEKHSYLGGTPVELVLLSFFAPELVVSIACQEWWEARGEVIRFREKGYKWSMTHSFFAEMGGFVYRDNGGNLRTVHSFEFLQLCEKKEIANPVITVKEIKDKSKSDTFGKTILVLQLLWFVLQVVVRGSRGLAVTLVELDTLSMAVLSILVLFLWWEKPLRPQSPYNFYYSHPGFELYPRTRSALSDAWKSEPGYLDKLIPLFTCTWKTPSSNTDEEETAFVGTDGNLAQFGSRTWMAKIDGNDVGNASICVTWMILGGLHLIAWNFRFPTGTEKILWRVASLVLAGTPLLVFVNMAARDIQRDAVLANFAFIIGVISRTLLVGLTLASLRALPCSAHQTVSWTTYIPHL